MKFRQAVVRGSVMMVVLTGLVLAGCSMNKKKETKSEPAPAPAPTMAEKKSQPKSTQPDVTPVAVVDLSDAPSNSGSSSPQPVAAAPVTPAAPAASGGVQVDPSLAAYKQRYRISGRLRSVGSDSMDKVMQYWEKSFTKYHPKLQVFHEGKGSSTAPPALAEGLSDFGPMSRPIKDKEIKLIKDAVKYEPTQIPVALDALAVYVHPDNPVAKSGLTFTQLDAIFGSSLKRGAGKQIMTWGELGLTGEWADAKINVYSRNKASGTYGFFKDHVLAKGTYKTTNRELVGSEEVVSSVANDKFGIGYSGIGYKTPSVAVTPLAKDAGQSKFPPKPEYAYSGQYPLARYLYVTILKKPGTKLTPLQEEFLRFAYSREGQALVIEDGYFPLSNRIVSDQMGKIGLKP